MGKNYFEGFKTGTLFLIRTPDAFLPGYADKSLEDMRKAGLSYITWLETWNCEDGVLWISPKYPRSSYWKNEPRDPLEETFAAADRQGMAFLPEAGVMHQEFFDSNQQACVHNYKGEPSGRYGRIGLVPDAPETLEYFIDKYETLIDKFRGHKSLKGICLPSENSVRLSCDSYTRKAYRETFGEDIPPMEKIENSSQLQQKVCGFVENRLALFFSRLALHLKSKYGVAIMHYPLGLLSGHCHFQPMFVPQPARLLSSILSVKETDIFNMQVHPTLDDNPYFFKAESEIIQAIAKDRPCIADTHFYHEICDGKLPASTPKRFRDWILGTLTPNGISFFCYGFFAPQLPPWKKEINPGARVFNAYSEPEIVDSRRKETLKALSMVNQIAPLMEGSFHDSECAIFYNEDIKFEYEHGSWEKEHLFGLYEVFQAASIPVKFISEIPESPTGTKLVCLDSVKNLSEERLKTLSKFLRAGGRAVILGDCGVGLNEMLGLKISPAKGNLVKISDHGGGDFANRVYACPYCAKDYSEAGGMPLYYWSDDSFAVTEKKIGEGKIIYIGAYSAFSEFSYYRRTTLIGVLKNIIKQLNGEIEVEIEAPYRKTLKHAYLSADIYRSRKGGSVALMIRNFGVEADNVRIRWRIPEHADLRFFTDGKEMRPDYKWADGVFSTLVPRVEDMSFIWLNKERRNHRGQEADR
jgi:hypothetical protein